MINLPIIPAVRAADAKLLAPDAPDKLKIIMRKVWVVTKYILLGVATLFMAYMCPVPFAIGLIIGALFPKSMEAMIRRIEDFLKRKPWLIGIGVVVAAWTFPYILLGAAFVVGVHCGVEVRRLKRKK